MNNITIKKEEILKKAKERFGLSEAQCAPNTLITFRVNEDKSLSIALPQNIESFLAESLDSLIATAREEEYDRGYNAGFVAGVRRWEETHESPSEEEMKSDALPFIHGSEGTHAACIEMVNKLGKDVGCCGCNGHKCGSEKGNE